MRALWLSLALLVGAAQVVAAQDAPVEVERAADARAERIASWREALELDLAGEVLASVAALEGGAASLSADGEALALYASALAASGQRDAARRALRSASEDTTERAAIDVALAALDLDEDRLAEVEARLAEEDGSVRAELQDAPRAWFLLGRARVRAGATGRARVPLEAFVERWPRHADAPAAWHMLAQEALERRDLERARECRERGAELGRWHAYYRTRRLQCRANPDAPEPRIGLAQLWIAAEDWNRARAELDPVLTRHPEACAAWTTLGELERKQGRLAESRAAYARAVACDPDQHVARFALGLLLVDAGEPEAARVELEALCDDEHAGSDRRFVGAHLALARVLVELGDEKSATRRYARYRELGGTEALEASR
ncbi:MAG: hypothetical protein H6831_10940 [Planctomycetes bacterium]|nr:hypothetical protein [Planctomycetota bacterium]MCB9904913.1 hypothetical protein [Planctomycetota bacterium]